MKLRSLAVLGALLAVSRPAQAQGWQPAAGLTQIPLWPGSPPNARTLKEPEIAATVIDSVGRPKLVAGKPWTYVNYVSRPTMTVYPPHGANTGAAVMVFPGGGYFVLAMDLEGTEACDWLTVRGITCVLLKCRVPCDRVGMYRDCLTALQDAQRALSLLRSRAAEFRIDPHRIGVLGFSAGGHMVVTTSTHVDRRSYTPVDSVDRVSCRPDFAIALYPGHIAVRENNFVLNPAIHVTSETPPTILIQAENDPVDPIENSLVYYGALRKAGVSAELHVYPTGGHAFALRETSAPITRWPRLVETWLQTIGMVTSPR